MPLLNSGALVAAPLLIGKTSKLNYSQTNARIAIGSSSTAFNKTQTGLSAEIGRKPVDAAPTETAGTLRFSATFNPGEATCAWNEWGPVNAASAGDFLTRKVETTLGTKAAGDTWQLVGDIAIGA